MSLFDNNFEAAFYIAAALWFVALPLGAAISYGGFLCFKNAATPAGKWSALLPFVIALPLLIAGIIGLSMTIGNLPIWNKIRTERHAWVLQDTTVIDGVSFPPETKIYFSRFFKMKNKRQAELDDIDRVELGSSTEFLGFPVEGIIEGKIYKYEIFLSEDITIDGFPISKGKAIIERDGTFQNGKLSKNYSLKEVAIPKGSEVKFPLLDTDKGVYQVYFKGKDEAYRIDVNTDEVTDISPGYKEL